MILFMKRSQVRDYIKDRQEYRGSLQFMNFGGKETFVKCKIVKIKADFSSKTVKWGEKILKSTFL